MNTKKLQTITLNFSVDQEATPKTLAQRIACVLALYDSLRVGEKVSLMNGKTEYLVTEKGVAEIVNGQRTFFWNRE